MAFLIESSEILAALYSRLSSDVDIYSIVGTNVYSYVPQDLVFPYIRFNINESDSSCKNLDGIDIEITIDLFTSTETQGALTVTRLADYVRAALTKEPLELLISENILLDYVNQFSFQEPDGVNHSQLRFKGIISAITESEQDLPNTEIIITPGVNIIDKLPVDNRAGMIWDVNIISEDLTSSMTSTIHSAFIGSELLDYTCRGTEPIGSAGNVIYSCQINGNYIELIATVSGDDNYNLTSKRRSL